MKSSPILTVQYIIYNSFKLGFKRLHFERSTLDLLLKSLAELATVPMLLQECAESAVLALKFPFSIGNESPSDDTANGCKRSSNQEYSLHAVESAVKRILNRREYLCEVRYC